MNNASYFIIENGVLKKYNGPGGDVIIPEGVTSIGDGAFYMCVDLHSVTIPKGVTSFENEAFANCEKLNTITIPEGVTSIGFAAFLNCIALTSITIPEGVLRIGRSAFYACSNLSSVTIPESVVIIDDKAFCNCISLKNVTIPARLRRIGDEAFFGCPKLTVTIPDGLYNIPDYPHPYDENSRILINNINRLPPTLRPNAAVGFAANGGSKETPGFDNHSKYIKTNAAKLVNRAITEPALLTLMCREKLITPKNVELFLQAAQKSGNVELIAMMLDYNANAISSRQKEILERRKEIEQCTVNDRLIDRQGKTGIEGLNITADGKLETFTNRNELKDFIRKKGGKLLPSLTPNTDYYVMNDPNSDTHSAQKAKDLGIEIIGEQLFLEIAGSTFFIDGEKLVRYLGNDRDVVIPNHITSIGEKAFINCQSMMSVTIPECIVSIGEWAFAHCTALKTVTIPDCVTIINYSSFRDCRRLTEVVFSRSLRSIGNKAFLGCCSLTNALIPEGVESIGEEAFSDCNSLINVRIPQSVKSIRHAAFWGCSKLTNLAVPDNLSGVAWSAFHGCIGLADMEGFIIIDHVLYEYVGAQSIVSIPDSVKVIGNNAFQGCDSINKITISNSVTTIGDHAFYACHHLKDVVIPESVTRIGSFAFSKCGRLKNLTIPYSVKYIGYSAFQGHRLPIHASVGSYAEQYARSYGIPFVAE